MEEPAEGTMGSSGAAEPAPPLPRSFSYRVDHGNEPASTARSPNNSPLGSRMSSRESLLGSRRESVFGSRYGFGNTYVQVDDMGVYLSSIAFTLLISAMATILIILGTLVVTFSVMLGKCQQQKSVPNTCASLALNGELNNVQGWLLSDECKNYVAHYVQSGQYHSDFKMAVDAAQDYLETVTVHKDAHDLIVLDIDETCLSNMAYYESQHFVFDEWKEDSWNSWIESAIALPLEPMLSMYNDLRAQNWSFAFITGRPWQQYNATAQNLLAAGFEGWRALILRAPEEVGLTALEYKSNNRENLQAQGYRVWSALGDQWSDISGPASGLRTFKLPNPMYYVY